MKPTSKKLAKLNNESLYCIANKDSAAADAKLGHACSLK